MISKSGMGFVLVSERRGGRPGIVNSDPLSRLRNVSLALNSEERQQIVKL